MKLHSIDGPTQVGYAKRRPTVLVGAVCGYLDSLFLTISSLCDETGNLHKLFLGNSYIQNWI